MSVLQGNASIGILVIRAIGILGAVIGIAAHFMTWTTIDVGTQGKVDITGYEGMGVAGIAILAVYALLLILDSVYAPVVLVAFIPYMLEQVIGTNLLRYMPLETTKLLAPLYLLMPTGFGLAVIGAFAPVLSHLRNSK